jgi:hypothetical protein
MCFAADSCFGDLESGHEAQCRSSLCQSKPLVFQLRTLSFKLPDACLVILVESTTCALKVALVLPSFLDGMIHLVKTQQGLVQVSKAGAVQARLPWFGRTIIKIYATKVIVRIAFSCRHWFLLL